MIWPQIIGGVLGGGLSLFGAKKSADAANAQTQLQADVLNRLAGINYSPQATTTPGGAGVLFGQQPYLQLGEFAPFADRFLGGAGRFLDTGNMQVGDADKRLSSIFQSGDLATMLRNQAYSGIQQGTPLSGLAQSVTQQANPFANTAAALTGEAGRGFDSLRNDTLSLLRQQAQPFEDRAFSNLQENLFKTGRLGSTGGGLQTEAFARGLAQADLDRQLQATNVAQSQQAQTGNLASLFGGLANQTNATGANIAGIENDLLNSAFGRFAQTSGLAADLNQFGFNRGTSNINLGMQNLAGYSGILDNILKLGNFGANLGATDAQVAVNAAGGQANIANNLGLGGGDVWGNFLTTLGGNMDWGKVGQGVVDWAGGLFGGNKTGSGITGAGSVA